MKKTKAPCHPTFLVIHSRSPLRYRCNFCRRTYTARYGEISYGSKLSPQEILSVLTLLKRNTSIRRTAQILHLSPSTVERWKQRFLQEKVLFISPLTSHYEHTK